MQVPVATGTFSKVNYLAECHSTSNSGKNGKRVSFGLSDLPYFKVFERAPVAIANCSQIEKRTCLNVFRSGSQPRAASKIQDALHSGKFACS